MILSEMDFWMANFLSCLESLCSFRRVFGAYKKCSISGSGRLMASTTGHWLHTILCSSFLCCQLTLVCFITALGPGSLFGLATFSHKIGLYDVQGPVPVVKNVFIPPDVDDTLPMELEDVMPLLSFLAPVSTILLPCLPVH